MKGKTGGLIVLTLGVLLIVVGLVIKFVIFPGQAQWPDDVDSYRYYDGTLHVMLNPQALQSMDLANLFLRDVPITINRHVTTEETEGGKAVVREYAELLGPDGSVLQPSDDWYAIDRKTMDHLEMEKASGFDNSDKIKERAGLVIGFPIGTEKKAYDGWNDDFQITLQAEYQEKVEHEKSGLNTYLFKSSSSAREIKDQELLALFPPGLPKDLFLMLAQDIDVPEAMQGMFSMLLPLLPDPVPFKYTYEYETTYWIEPTTGVLVDYDKHEARKVALSKELLVEATQGIELPENAATLLSMLPDPLPLMPVFEQSFHMSDASIADATDDAKDAKGQIELFGTTMPLGAIVVGLALILVGLVLMRAGGREETAQDV